MQENKEVDITSRHPALEKYNIDGDIRAARYEADARNVKDV
jgi:hypothetical protein